MGAFSLIVVINLLNRLSNVIPGAQFSRTAIVSNITSRRLTSSLNTSRYILKPKTVSSSNTLVPIRQESSVQTVEKGTEKIATTAFGLKKGLTWRYRLLEIFGGEDPTIHPGAHYSAYYRALAPDGTYRVHKLVSQFVLFCMALGFSYHFYYHPYDVIPFFDNHHFIDPDKFTDEELGVPPDDWADETDPVNFGLIKNHTYHKMITGTSDEQGIAVPKGWVAPHTHNLKDITFSFRELFSKIAEKLLKAKDAGH